MRPVPVAGIDVSKDFSDMCILSPDNAVFERVKIYHDKTSMERAVKKLAHAGAVFGQRPIVVMEATGHYHRILYRFLSLHRFSIVTINPLQSSAIKNVSIRKIKNDQTDAYRLALAYRTQALKANLVPSDKIENMRLLIRQHFDLKKHIGSYILRLESIVDQVFPGYREHFQRINCDTALTILDKYPTPRQLKRARTTTLAEMIRSTSRRSSEYCSQKAQELKTEANKASEIALERESSPIIIRSMIAVIRALSAEVDALDAELHRLIRSDEDISADVELLSTIPGIAEFSAAVIIAEIGDFSQFRKAKQLTSFFGLEPSVCQSGKYVGKNNTLSKRGSKYMRSVLLLISQVNIRHEIRKPDVYVNPVIADYYKRKCETKSKLSALCAVMHKLIHIIFAVLRDRKPYEIRTPEEHMNLMRARAATAA